MEGADNNSREARQLALKANELMNDFVEECGQDAGGEVPILEQIASRSVAYLREIQALYEQLAVARQITVRGRTVQAEFDQPHRRELLEELLTYDDVMAPAAGKVVVACIRAEMAA